MTFPRQKFHDGQVVHDYHLNGIQLEIAREIKKRYLINYYDLRLLNSPYIYYFLEPVIDTTRRDGGSALLDTDLLVITNTVLKATEDWTTLTMTLSQPTSEIMLFAEHKIPDNTAIDYYYLDVDGSTWLPLQPETPVAVTLSSIKLRVVLTASGQSKPQVEQFCLMWR
ncbi:hypothetical protein [Neomoorella thermoacetica]|uniref:hypothetical protein n=1 Tax=Neomoorella thermoacetica TaxID=1525 RepID=UPI00084CD84A|nr:hypothetical protein [Moorella thermoacetica]